MNRTALIPAALLVVASLMLAACSATGPLRDNSSHEVLKQRAEQRWQYLVNREAAKAWDYLTPGYRATKDRETYAAGMNSRPVRWTAVEVDDVECNQPDSCVVNLQVTYEIRVPGTGGAKTRANARLHERWLFLDNQWYHLPREAGGVG